MVNATEQVYHSSFMDAYQEEFIPRERGRLRFLHLDCSKTWPPGGVDRKILGDLHQIRKPHSRGRHHSPAFNLQPKIQLTFEADIASIPHSYGVHFWPWRALPWPSQDHIQASPPVVVVQAGKSATFFWRTCVGGMTMSLVCVWISLDAR